jgi:hypothetical protein
VILYVQNCNPSGNSNCPTFFVHEMYAIWPICPIHWQLFLHILVRIINFTRITGPIRTQPVRFPQEQSHHAACYSNTHSKTLVCLCSERSTEWNMNTISDTCVHGVSRDLNFSSVAIKVTPKSKLSFYLIKRTLD